MKEVDVDELEPGMVIARSVEDSNGRVLLQEGKELTPTVINSLQNLGKESVHVKEEDEKEEEKFESVEDMEEQLDHMYELVEDNETMKEMKEIAKKYLRSKLEGND